MDALLWLLDQDQFSLNGLNVINPHMKSVAFICIKVIDLSAFEYLSTNLRCK